MTSRSVRFLLACLFALTLSFTCTNAFGQGSKMRSPYDPIEEKDKDRPDRRAEWNQRGRIAPPGQSAAALRLRAHRQKMAMRAAREAAAKAGAAGANAPAVTSWVGLGPAPLVSDSNFYGTVSGRATSVAIDPSDSTGNTVYLGGAYGGVWKSTNAANSVASNVTWTPVTDQQASLATGAVSVKPSGGVVLVGTGEPDSAIDSYYGVGILRSTDGGANWSLIPSGDAGGHSFVGSGFTKFAWSTAQTGTVVASTAQAFRGVDEGRINGNTTNGLYLSTDSGLTWAYQSLTDGSAPISATDVVYNASAGKFFAAIRYHGVYSSTNGTSWTRLATQPSSVLTLTNCPTNTNPNCPMYRGQLAVVPGRNEMYFWFVNSNDTDEGIWRSTNGGGAWTKIDESGLTVCGDPFGCGTQQAFYNLEIAAVADGSATDLYAGTINLYKCKLASGATTCSQLDAGVGAKWINLTHVYGCPSIAGVHPDEHGLDFIPIASGSKVILYFANDGGVYRALDGFTDLLSGSCGKTNQFDDLNASLGSMTQFVSFSIHPTDQNTMLGGTQDNGSPATNAATSSSQWITVNGGDGGFNAINPTTPTQWFSANTDVSIQVCNSGINCNSNTFIPVVTNGTVGGDFGPFYTPYILDPQNSGELLVGTCRVWRGTTSGSAFLPLSVNFDTLSTNTCNGGEINQVHALAAGGPLQSGFSNVVYATTEGYGPFFNIGGGEVWVTKNAATTQMSNVTGSINPFTYPISSVAIDTSVSSGQTAYVGIMGFGVSHVFKTTDAGGTGQPSDWTDWTGTGLPDAPVNALLVDAQAGQVYAGTDVGLFVSSTSSAVWTEVGPAPGSGQSGYLPNVPVTAIRLFNSGGTKKLRVSTYGRGIWEFALAVVPDYQVTVSNNPLTAFPSQTAVFTGTLTSVNGYSSPVTLSCGAGAPGACTFPSGNPITPTNPFSVSMNAGVATTDYNFNIHTVGSDANTVTHDTPVTLHVVDFGLTDPNPATVSAQQGGTSNSTSFQVTAAGVFSGTVALTCTGTVITAGATCNFLPSASVNPTSANPVNASVTVNVPASVAVNNYTVTINANTAGAPAAKTKNFTLQVTAPPDFTWVINGPNAKTVLAGQSATYSFTATPVGSGTFTSDVTVSCGNTNPALTACGFDKQIHAGDPATTVMLTITTTGPNTGTVSPRRADNRGPWLPLTFPLAGVLIMGMAGRRVSRYSARAGLCVSLMLLGLLVACGGGGSGPPPPPQISVTVGPGVPASLFPNQTGWPSQTAQFTATVNNTSNKAVTWAVTGAPANGTIDANGLYTAPMLAPGLPATVNITATSQADSTKSGSRSETLSVPTALGTYTVTVTATEGVVSHSPNPPVSLTVQ